MQQQEGVLEDGVCPTFFHFAELPEELQSHILSFLTPRDLVLSAHSVCWHWNSILLNDHILWQKAHTAFYGGLQTISFEEDDEKLTLSWRATCISAMRYIFATIISIVK